MLRYTGHPLVDVGVATIMAFVGKREPAQLTAADFDQSGARRTVRAEGSREQRLHYLIVMIFRSITARIDGIGNIRVRPGILPIIWCGDGVGGSI